MSDPVFLVQPPAEGMRSGGYTYNEEIGSRLERTGRGCLLELPRERLWETPWPRPCRVLVDSLLVPPPLERRQLAALAREPISWYLLLHLWPLEDPTASKGEKTRWLRAVRSWLPLLRGVVVTGERAAAEWRTYFPATFAPVVAPPAIAPATPRVRQHPSGAGRRLVTIGTLCPRKNQRLILETLLELPERNFHWDLIGGCDPSNSYAAEFIARVRETALVDRVHLHGPLPASACDRLLDRADLYVSASLCESFGMATASALARGVPTLSFEVGDVGRWVTAGPEAGVWILDPADPAGFRMRLSEWCQAGEAPLAAPAARIPCRDWSETLEHILAMA